jgi:hypothetical protein
MPSGAFERAACSRITVWLNGGALSDVVLKNGEVKWPSSGRHGHVARQLIRNINGRRGRARCPVLDSRSDAEPTTSKLVGHRPHCRRIDALAADRGLQTKPHLGKFFLSLRPARIRYRKIVSPCRMLTPSPPRIACEAASAAAAQGPGQAVSTPVNRPRMGLLDQRASHP